MREISEDTLRIILSMLDNHTLFYKIPWVSKYINDITKTIPITLRVAEIIEPYENMNKIVLSLARIYNFHNIKGIDYPLYWHPEILTAILIYYPCIKEITLRYYDDFPRTSMSWQKNMEQIMFPVISRVSKLDIENWIISESELVNLLSNGSNIQELVMPIYIENSAVFDVLSHCRKLRKLYLHYYKDMSDDMMEGIVNNCPRLTTLRISASNIVTDKTLEHLSKLKLQSLTLITSYGDTITGKGLEKLTTLRTLSLHSCNLQDKHIQNMLKNCLQLHTLILRFSNKITDQAFMVDKCSKTIVNLVVENCVGIEGKGIVNLSKRVSLCKLSIDNSSVTSSGLNEILSHSPRLTHLSINHCENIDNIGLENIWKKCPYLSKLFLDCTCVSKYYVTTILNNLKYLRILSAEFIGIDTSKLQDIIPNLTELYICYNLDTNLDTIASKFPNLKKLSVNGCTEDLYRFFDKRPDIDKIYVNDPDIVSFFSNAVGNWYDD